MEIIKTAANKPKESTQAIQTTQESPQHSLGA